MKKKILYIALLFIAVNGFSQASISLSPAAPYSIGGTVTITYTGGTPNANYSVNLRERNASPVCSVGGVGTFTSNGSGTGSVMVTIPATWTLGTDCSGTSTIGTTRAFRVSVVGGGGINANSAQFEITASVPIELAKFEVKNSEKSAMLTWVTASEIDNAFFALEHSTNGLEFRTIGEMKGQGTTNATTTYNYEHSTPSVGINYYRLNQVDFNGQATYSPTRSVLFGKKGLVIKTTLVHDALDVLVSDDAPTTINIFSISGQQVFSGKVQGEQRIDVSTLTAGIYFLRTPTGEVGRFVKE